GMLLPIDLGWRCRFDGHNGPPHLLINGGALLRHLAAGHPRPVLSYHRVNIIARQPLQLVALWFLQSLTQTIDVEDCTRLQVDVQLRFVQGGPHGVKHKSQDNRIGCAKHGQLPTDEIVVTAPLLPRPNSVQPCHNEQRCEDRYYDCDNVLTDTRHERYGSLLVLT